jgi:16S rRNA (adenine1518-N6/adenine1519-N6)-dimethyltransferase
MSHVARKRFGQNFLVDQDVVARIIASLGLRRDDPVVEIGPGLGALTTPLLACLDRLDAVELDRDLVQRLTSRYGSGKLRIHSADALSYDFSALGNGLRVVGNLPYNISTPLLFHLSEFAGSIRDITVMLQKEVVDRMVARPATADYGRLSVMLQYRFELDKLLDVPPESFQPQPRVHSAVVRLVPRPAQELVAADARLFSALVAAAFGQRRKMLRTTVAAFASEKQLAALGVEPTLRGENLAVADYVRIANACAAAAQAARV